MWGLYYVIKSKRCDDRHESARLVRTARRTSLFIMILTLIFAFIPAIIYTYQNEIINLFQPFNSTNNKTETIQTNVYAMNSSFKTTHITAFSSSTLTRVVKTIAKTTTQKNYDRLSILIDHELFKSLKVNSDLFQKLRISNESLVLNPSWCVLKNR